MKKITHVSKWDIFSPLLQQQIGRKPTAHAQPDFLWVHHSRDRNLNFNFNCRYLYHFQRWVRSNYLSTFQVSVDRFASHLKLGKILAENYQSTSALIWALLHSTPSFPLSEHSQLMTWITFIICTPTFYLPVTWNKPRIGLNQWSTPPGISIPPTLRPNLLHLLSFLDVTTYHSQVLWWDS